MNKHFVMILTTLAFTAQLHSASSEHADAEQAQRQQVSLHEAVELGQIETVRGLILNGADINAQDQFGYTPLHVAARDGHEGIVQMLIRNGANIDAQNEHGNTPLHVAVFHNHYAIIGILIRNGAKVDAQDESEGTLLHQAACHGHEATLRILILNKADVNAQDITGHTPLHMAAWWGNDAAVQLLLEAEADVNAQSADGQTPLHKAAYYGHEAVVLRLINAGAHTDEHQRSPLLLVLSRGAQTRPVIAKLLIERLANVDSLSDKQTEKLDVLVPDWRNIRKVLHQAIIELFESEAADRLCQHTSRGIFPTDLMRLITHTMLGLQDAAAACDAEEAVASRCRCLIQ